MDERPYFSPSGQDEPSAPKKEKKKSFAPKGNLPKGLSLRKVLLGGVLLVLLVILLNSLVCGGDKNNSSSKSDTGIQKETQSGGGSQNSGGSQDGASEDLLSGESERAEYSGDVVITVSDSEEITSDEVDERESLISDYLKVNDINDLSSEEKRNAAIYQLIQVAWSRAAASKEGVAVPAAVVQQKASEGGGALTKNLLQAGYSEAQVEDLIRLEIIRQKLRKLEVGKAKRVKTGKVRKAYKKAKIKKPFPRVKKKLKKKIRAKQVKRANKQFQTGYEKFWRSQTACAPEYKVDACGSTL